MISFTFWCYYLVKVQEVLFITQIHLNCMNNAINAWMSDQKTQSMIWLSLGMRHTKNICNLFNLTVPSLFTFYFLRSKSNKWCVKFPLQNIYKVNITLFELEKKKLCTYDHIQGLLVPSFCNFSKPIMHESHGCS